MKYVLALVIVSGVALGASLWLHTNAVSPNKGVVTATITLTDDGFRPTEVTVRRGEAVRWVNDSGAEMWPASAVHPTHSIYPQKSANDCLGSSFDACRRIPRGGTWEFTFTYAGDWKFHDHVQPANTGIVHVTQ